jgi:hypothetical protein
MQVKRIAQIGDIMETAIEKARRVGREMREGGKIEVENNLVIKAERKPSSLKLAIAAMCFQCFGGTKTDMPDPGWKRMIATCTAPDCALFDHRPYKADQADEEADIMP